MEPRLTRARARVRIATAADLGEVQALERDVFGDEAYPAFFFRQALDALGHGFFVAKHEHAIAGYVLGSLAVATSARGRGFAGALLDAVEATLFDAGADGVRLHVSPKNESALRLYERRGYVPIAHLQDAFGPGHDRFVLRRTRPS
jgi:ribosomal protein S18 acetylase RimI-like enzyme